MIPTELNEISLEEELPESFVFYKSFVECIRMFDEDKQLELLNALIDAALYGQTPPNALIAMMMKNVKASQKRYIKAVENGSRGGKPAKVIEPEIWQSYYDDHTRKETAEFFGITESLLKKWITKTGYIKGNGYTGKNLTYTDTVTDNDTDTYTVTEVTDICTCKDNKTNKTKNEGHPGEPLKAPVCPSYTPEEGETVLAPPHLSPVSNRWLVKVRKADGRKVERYVN